MRFFKACLWTSCPVPARCSTFEKHAGVLQGLPRPGVAHGTTATTGGGCIIERLGISQGCEHLLAKLAHENCKAHARYTLINLHARQAACSQSLFCTRAISGPVSLQFMGALPHVASVPGHIGQHTEQRTHRFTVRA